MASSSDQPGASVKITPVFHVDLLKGMEFSSNTDSTVPGVEGLPAGSTLLVVRQRLNAGSRFLLDQTVTTTGCHPDSDIFLDDVAASRRHAELRKNGDSYKVVDAESLNGVYVNREPKNSAVLASGDEA